MISYIKIIRSTNLLWCAEHSEGESLFYIVSPKDVVVAKERDQDDHIDWLLDKKKYEEALMAAEISFKNIKRHDVQKIGMAYINHLVEKGDYDGAARFLFNNSYWH